MGKRIRQLHPLLLGLALATVPGCITIDGGGSSGGGNGGTDSGGNSGGNSGGDSERCIAGKQCSCTGTTCNQQCETADGGCQFSCDADTCSNTCDGGGCQMSCDGDECVLDCKGGGCNLTCGNGTSVCRITGCDSMCVLTCNGAPTCESSCSEVPGLCSTTP